MDVVVYKCPNCDAGLAFDPKSQKFRCEYCGSYFSQQELEKPDASGAAKEVTPKESREDDTHTVVYSCPTCGAEIATDETTAATFCYYCHNPVVLSSRLDGKLKPDKVIPFTIDREQAVNALLGWVGKKWFVPKDFFSKSQIEKTVGVYFPFWMINGQMQAMLTAKATKIKTWVLGNTRYTETSYYDIKRGGDAAFKEIAKNALKKENSRLINGVHPYDCSAAKDFSSTYLTGFQAEKRNIEKSDYEAEVRREIGDYTKSLLSDSISGYDGVSPGSFDVGKTDLQYSYTLLPTWVLTYKGDDGKIYYYTMNGQTGKTSGVLPVSLKKLILFFAGVSSALFLILLTGSYLL